MIQTFRNLKMGIKIFGGFSIVLLLLLIVAISGYNGLTGVVDSSYKKDSVGQLTQCFSEARQYEKQFIMKNDPGDAKKLGMEITTLTQKANRLKKAFNEKNFHAKMNHVIQAANRYGTAFEQFTELRNQKIQKMQDMRQKARDVRIFCESISKDQVAQLKQLRKTNALYITRKIARADDANELVKLALDAKHYRSLIMQGNLDAIDDWKAINQAVYALTQKMKTQFQTQKNIQQTQAIIDQYKSYETQILSFITQYKRSRQQIEFKSSIALGAIEDIQKAQQKQLKNLLARADMNYSQFNLNQLTDKQRKLDEAHRMIRYANMEQNLRQSLIRGELELVDLWKAYIQKLIKISNYIKSLFRHHANIFQAKKVIQRYEGYEHAVLTFIDYYEKTHQAIQKTAITLMETIETVRDDQKSQLDLAQKEFEMKLNNKLSLVTDAHAIVKWFIDARKNEKEFIISGDKKYLNIVQGDIQKIQTLCEKIEGKLEIQKNITQIQSVVAATRAYLETFTNYIALTDKQNISEDNMQKAAQTAQEACQNAFVNQEKMMNEQVNTTETMIILMVVIAIGLGLFISFAITKGVLRPIVKSLDFTRSMADGNFTMKLDIDQKDEMGDLSIALNEMRQKVSGMIREIAASVDTVSSSSTELSSVSEGLANNASKSSDLSNNVAGAADEMSANMNTVAAAVEETSANVATVASAAEEMTATINEISNNTEKAHKITEQAVNKAREASDRVNQLGESAKEIGTVTQTITDISEQTNLLALNATIESARAGETGKGFAVVASEIKELAKQTSLATEEIRLKIDGIQQSTSMSVDEIIEITRIIQEVNEIVGSIAAAMGEQSTATKEIASNVAQASLGTNEVSSNVSQTTLVTQEIARDISTVNTVAKDVSQDSRQVQQSAMSLSGLAEKLNHQIRKFRV